MYCVCACVVHTQIEVKLSFSEPLSNPCSLMTDRRVMAKARIFRLFVSLSKSEPANYRWLLDEEKKRKICHGLSISVTAGSG